MKTKNVSIIVPTLNEEQNIRPLIKEVDAVMKKNSINYEIIFIDDHSADKTRHKILELIDSLPVRLYLKEGNKGKATSLIEGFKHAKHDVVCMIDADLQYPPTAIPLMVEKLFNNNADVVVASRSINHVSLRRKIMSKGFQLFFARFLHGLQADVQSGLKVFRKEILERVTLSQATWAFDMEFLIKAQHAGYKIDSIDIEFKKRRNGYSKLGIIKPAFEIGMSALKLRVKQPGVIPFHPEKLKSHGEGFNYRGNEFMNYTKLALKESAFRRTSLNQKLGIVILLELLLLAVLVFSWHTTLVFLLGSIITLYVVDLLFNLYLVYKSFNESPELNFNKRGLAAKREWPLYTIYCPLYKEAGVVPQFINAIQNLDYPKDKLQVLLLLEEDDKDTIRKVLMYNLPYYFTVLVVPDSQPKTKPKALNYGLKYTNGEFAVIYDAEDVPEPDQLKKTVLAFEKADKKTICIQAKLKFYNPNQNVLTKLFAADYSLWFDVVLPGLQSIGAPIPLGGTSNHFRTNDLRSLQGWDPFNVTEDADLGMRIMKRGFKTAIVDSYTLEEANSDLGNWFKQRSRWIKGYMMTYLVHMRNTGGIKQTLGNRNFWIFQLIVGGKIASMLLNPIMWGTTLAYFIFRPEIGLFIESLFPPVVLYLGAFSLIFGNFLYAYYYMLGAAKQGHWENIYVALIMPLYWLGISISAAMAAVEIVTNPHYWHKTKHGLHLEKDDDIDSDMDLEAPKGDVAIVPATA